MKQFLSRFKTRLFLTAITFVLYFIFNSIFAVVEAPIKGALNAQQMHDTVEGYAIAQASANNYIETVIFVGLVILLVIIWSPLVCKYKKVAETFN
jgi:hypothetical protein